MQTTRNLETMSVDELDALRRELEEERYQLLHQHPFPAERYAAADEALAAVNRAYKALKGYYPHERARLSDGPVRCTVYHQRGGRYHGR